MHIHIHTHIHLQAYAYAHIYIYTSTCIYISTVAIRFLEAQTGSRISYCAMDLRSFYAFYVGISPRAVAGFSIESYIIV